MKNLFKILIIIQIVFMKCKESQEVYFNQTTKNIECLECNLNCDYCYYNTIKYDQTCYKCKDGFYWDNDGLCKECIPGCSECDGSLLENCSYLNKGKFYNIHDKKIDDCSENCYDCDSKDKCVNCNDGYNINENTCEKIKIPHCLFTDTFYENNKQTYQKCIICDKEYGMFNDVCEKCQTNCKYCDDNAKLCDVCHDGYTLDKVKNTCETKIENCEFSKNGNCDKCEKFYYLDYKDNKCNLIDEKIKYCSHAQYKEIQDSKKELYCTYCHKGFRLENNQCLPCQDNCLNCNSNECYKCTKGHTLINNECQKCDIENCKLCGNDNKCMLCKSGYYFNNINNKCEKCHENCFMCTGSSERECKKCYINKFTLDEKIIQENKLKLKELMKDNPLFKILDKIMFKLIDKTKINQATTVKHCLNECPKEFNNQVVFTNELRKQCILIKEDSSIEKKEEIINTGEIKKETNNSITKLKILFSDYQKYLSKNIVKFSNETNINYSKECNYNGTLKKEFKSNKESYFICLCLDGYIGDNCQLLIEDIKNFNFQIFNILNTLEENLKEKKNNDILIDTLFQIKEFKLMKFVISKGFQLLTYYDFLEENLEHKKKYFRLFDIFILASYDLLEDIKRNKDYNTNVDLIQEKKNLYSLIKNIVNLLMITLSKNFNTSFVSNKNDTFGIFGSFDLYSYHINEYNFGNFQLNDYLVQNPYIDSVSYHSNSNIKVNFQPKLNNNDIILQIISFSYEIFNNILNNKKKIFITNLVMMRLFNYKLHQTKDLNSNPDLKKWTINFSLRELPAYVNLDKVIKCISFDYSSNKIKETGILKLVDENNFYVGCEYPTSMLKMNTLLGVIEDDLVTKVYSKYANIFKAMLIWYIGLFIN